jgi:hypothetical protein
MSKKSRVALAIADTDKNKNECEQPTCDLLVGSVTKARDSKVKDPLGRLNVLHIARIKKLGGFDTSSLTHPTATKPFFPRPNGRSSNTAC